MQEVLKVLLYIVFFYVLVLAVAYIFQRKLTYAPESVGVLVPSEWGAATMAVVTVETEDHLAIRGWYQKAEEGKPTVVFVHGNAGHLGGRVANVMPYLARGYGVFLVGYRGYSGNPGKPSELGLYRDARAAMEFLIRQSVACHDIILHGESLGSAVAVQMALEYPAGLLVLQAPFNALAAVGRVHYPFLPVKFLLKAKFDSESKMPKIHVPLVIFHGDQDSVVPAHLSEQLFLVANQPKQYIMYPGMHHSDMDPEKIAFDVVAFYQKHDQAVIKCQL
jgi:uncharacterized protein